MLDRSRSSSLRSAAATHRHKEAATDWTNPRILIVAASPALRFTLEELLRYYGYDVVSAASGEAALGPLAHSRFDVVLFENQVDGVGFSLVELLSSCPTNWGMPPVVALR